ncbi:MAG: tyrosine--tRNA ligase [Candidatus Moranbacteria bacterium CG23_combo_of_CG06-09_8_20_14_all_35_22]|nr:MAG: tyrosine--tRNA ligase [Candidatus Moranbacteria bacterium CG23_combo_of_CG06-09_8_20_14_all_35_22]
MAKIITDEKLIDELLERGTEEVIVKDHLKKRMMAGEKLRIKLGIDPTGSVLHLGHAVVLKKLKQFQDLGHQVIFLIGDFTAKIGDPTGRASARKPLTEEDIKKNMESYQKQAGIMLDMEKVEVRYNSEWLAKLSFKDLIILTSKITYAQMAQRADFKERIKNDIDLSMQEFMYPAMQGYDSVVLKADVELGGTDQKFNLLMGRQLQKRYDQKPQDVLTCPLLEGLGGTDKMSKSLNNFISLTEEAESMFGKVMSLTDELIVRYFELCTEISLEEIKKIKKDLENSKVNPRDVKIKLAFEITKIYHGEKKANEAKEYFEKVISRKEMPDEVKEEKVNEGERLIDFIVKIKLAQSNADAKRKIEQGGVSLDGEIIKDIQTKISKAMEGKILKVGKREFRKIVVE